MKIAIGVWVLFFGITVGLAVAAIATSNWMVATDSVTDNEDSFGLWGTQIEAVNNCSDADVMHRAKQSVYSRFHSDAVAGLIIACLVVDLVSLVVGAFHCRAILQGKQFSKSMTIPTIVITLIAAELILLGCLVWEIDVSKISDQPGLVHDQRCQSDYRNIQLMVHFGWSFYLALGSAAGLVLKAGLFGIICCFCGETTKDQKTPPVEDDGSNTSKPVVEPAAPVTRNRKPVTLNT